ncbi:MAG: hypothetical protein ACYC75_01945 [Minisyncoccota bacterium]
MSISNEEAVKGDRAELATALAENIEFIAIVEASPGAIQDPSRRKRLLLLEVRGDTEDERIRCAREQLGRKSEPWEYPLVLYKLTPIPAPTTPASRREVS